MERGCCMFPTPLVPNKQSERSNYIRQLSWPPPHTHKRRCLRDVFIVLGPCSDPWSPDALTSCRADCPIKQLVKMQLARRMQLRIFVANIKCSLLVPRVGECVKTEIFFIALKAAAAGSRHLCPARLPEPSFISRSGCVQTRLPTTLKGKSRACCRAFP